MNKRGAANVEVVLAFVLFITVMGFAIYFFNPVKSSGKGETASTYALDDIIKNASVKMTEYSVVLNPNSPIAIRISNQNAGYGAYAENYAGNKLGLNRTIDGSGDIIYINPMGNNFTTIRISEDISPGYVHIPPASSGPGLYKIASVSSEEILSEKRILQLKQSYYGDYKTLKSSLGVFSNNDFSFSLVFGDGDKIEAGSEIPGALNVFVHEKSIRVLRTDGRIKFGTLIVKIW